MGLVLAVVLCAFVLGRVAGGTLPRLAAAPVRRVRLLVVAFVLQLTGGLFAGVLPVTYPIGVACSGLFVLVFLAVNRAVFGIPLVAAGLLANIAVVAVNGQMPVSPAAAEQAGVTVGALDLADDPRHEPLTSSTRLDWLADTIPVALPVRPEVASPGDVLVAAGIGLYVVGGMRRSPPLVARAPGQAGRRLPADVAR